MLTSLPHRRFALFVAHLLFAAAGAATMSGGMAMAQVMLPSGLASGSVALCALSSPSTVTIPASFWAAAVPGNWSSSTKWSSGVVPNADGAVAVICVSTSTAVTIALDEPVALGTLLLGSGTPGAGYALSGGGSNTMSFSNIGNDAPAQISVADGTHVIDAPVVLASDLVVISTCSNPWTLSFGTTSSITDNGGNCSLTLSASNGTLVLSGSDNYGGGTIVTAGTLDATNCGALPDGGGLTIGTNAMSIFAGAALPRSAAPLPEPGTLVLLIAAVCSAAAYQCMRARRTQP
ncbi:MAG: autotransporter-associated beta strand repeat-containing protein [Thermoguttaceae bacterium]